MGIVLMIFGILMSLLGGAGFIITENWMNDPDFWWDHAGTDRYTNAVNLHSISMVVLGAGVLFLLLGVILYAIRRFEGQQAIRKEQGNKAAEYDRSGMGKEYAVAGTIFTVLGMVSLALGVVFGISPLILILMSLFFPLGLGFSRTAVKKRKEKTHWDEVPAMFCPNCGKRKLPEDIFCSGCGKRLVEEKIVVKE